MLMQKSICVIRGATAGAVAMLALVVAGSASGAPVLSSTAQVKSAVTPAATEARWWGWRGRRAYYRGYGWRRYGSGCHMSGGYYRPSLCW
jgi:hypothetical protein